MSSYLIWQKDMLKYTHTLRVTMTEQHYVGSENSHSMRWSMVEMEEKNYNTYLSAVLRISISFECAEMYLVSLSDKILNKMKVRNCLCIGALTLHTFTSIHTCN